MSHESNPALSNILIKYPKPLPPLQLITEEDETGFTGPEKVALTNAWRVIKRRFRRHASQIFLDFFTANEMEIERFRELSGKFNMESLHQHPYAVLRIYGRLIEEGLENAAHINVILTEVAGNHRKHHVTKTDVTLLTTAVTQHFERALNSISSPTLVLGLEKMSHIIVDYHDPDDEDSTSEMGLM